MPPLSQLAGTLLTPLSLLYSALQASTPSKPRLAIIIDADNVPCRYAASLLSAALKQGDVIVRRAYGDWSNGSLTGWRHILPQHGIRPVQQFAYTKGKNATDIAIIIDVMDLLQSGTVDGVCLASSDSDFTPLAVRLREAGQLVYGFGERRTPSPFIKACTTFVYLDTGTGSSGHEPTLDAALSGASSAIPEAFLLQLEQCIRTTADSGGWVQLTQLGQELRQHIVGFDQRDYGFSRLIDLIAVSGICLLESRRATSGNAKVIWVRLIKSARPGIKPA